MRDAVAVIRRFDYAPDRCELAVTFTTGRIDIYEQVPKGRFFNARIRDRFACREVCENC